MELKEKEPYVVIVGVGLQRKYFSYNSDGTSQN